MYCITKKKLTQEEIKLVSAKFPNLTFDKYYLGALCPNNHDIGNNRSLRFRSGSCYECAIKISKEKNNRKRRSNSEQFSNFDTTGEDKAKYKEATEPEQWLDVRGTIGKIDFEELINKHEYYQVSSWGRVRLKNNKLLDWFYLRCNIMNSGYVRTQVHRKHILVHIIVANAFHGVKPYNKSVVRHLDDVGTANYPSNLKWGTIGENNKDAIKNGNRLKIFNNELSEEEIKSEIWQKIGNSNYYISNMGRVSKDKKLLTIKIDRSGYLIVVIKPIRKASVHLLVANAFLLHTKTKDKKIVRHLDGNKTNCKLTNLKFGTLKENADDRHLHDGYNNAKGENHPNAKLTVNDIKNIKTKLANGQSTFSIAKEYNVNRWTIGSIKHGKTWSHVTI